MIQEHRDLLDKIATALLDKETIEAKDFLALLGEKVKESNDEAATPELTVQPEG